MSATIPRWLPNAISALRLALVPVLLWAAWMCDAALRRSPEETTWRYATLAVLLVIGVSDIVDGALARRYGLTSTTGALLDAIADKVCQVSLVLYLALATHHAFGPMPWWFVGVILGRDVALGGGILLLRRLLRDFRYTHRFHGKAAAITMFVLLVWILTGRATDLVPVGLGFVSALVVASTFAYVQEALTSATRTRSAH